MEFEVEPRESYYLSYTDKLITGSMLPNGSRGLVGSAVSGSNEYKGAIGYADYYSKLINPGYRSSCLRGVNFANPSKIYYDSVMPSFLEIYSMNGGKLVAAKWDDRSWGAYVANTFPSASVGLETPMLKIILSISGQLTASDAATIADNTWPLQYPFMNRYKNVTRIVDISNIVGVGLYEDNMPNDTLYFAPATNVTASAKYVLCQSRGSNGSLYSIAGYYNPKLTPTVLECLQTPALATRAVLGSSTNEDLLKGFFGFGADTYMYNATGSLTDYRYNYGANITGWKYGVLNGIPTSPKVVFRIGRFGQFRDMLEPRLYSKTFDQSNNSLDTPISVQFISGTQAWMTASNPTVLNPTDLGFYDVEMRSGQPFIDN